MLPLSRLSNPVALTERNHEVYPRYDFPNNSVIWDKVKTFQLPKAILSADTISSRIPNVTLWNWSFDITGIDGLL